MLGLESNRFLWLKGIKKINIFDEENVVEGFNVSWAHQYLLLLLLLLFEFIEMFSEMSRVEFTRSIKKLRKPKTGNCLFFLERILSVVCSTTEKLPLLNGLKFSCLMRDFCCSIFLLRFCTTSHLMSSGTWSVEISPLQWKSFVSPCISELSLPDEHLGNLADGLISASRGQPRDGSLEGGLSQHTVLLGWHHTQWDTGVT